MAETHLKGEIRHELAIRILQAYNSIVYHNYNRGGEKSVQRKDDRFLSNPLAILEFGPKRGRGGWDCKVVTQKGKRKGEIGWVSLPLSLTSPTHFSWQKWASEKNLGYVLGKRGGRKCLDKKEVRIDGQGCKRTFRAAVVRYCGLVKPRRRGKYIRDGIGKIDPVKPCGFWWAHQLSYRPRPPIRRGVAIK